MTMLNDKVVLVSGGSQGVGAAVARAAAREGAIIAVTGRRPERGEALARELTDHGAKAIYVRTDVADVAQARESVAAVIRAFGRIDCLVNCAGLTARGTLLDTTPDLFDQHIAVNLRGPFFLMQSAVADMLSRHAPGPGRVLGGEVRAGRPDPQRGPRAPLRPHPHQRSQHRLDRD